MINHKQNAWMMIIGILLIGIGFASGWLGFLLFGDIARNCEVVFISKEAIIRAEEARVGSRVGNKLKEEGSNDENRIFFGKTSEALDYIDAIASTYSDRRTKVLFVATDSGLARGGVPISNMVHEEVIDILRKKKGKNEGG